MTQWGENRYYFFCACNLEIIYLNLLIASGCKSGQWIYDVTTRALFSIEWCCFENKTTGGGGWTRHRSFFFIKNTHPKVEHAQLHNIPVLDFHLCKILIYLFFALRFKCIFPIKNKRFTSVIWALKFRLLYLVHYQQYISPLPYKKFSKQIIGKINKNLKKRYFKTYRKKSMYINNLCTFQVTSMYTCLNT